MALDLVDPGPGLVLLGEEFERDGAVCRHAARIGGAVRDLAEAPIHEVRELRAFGLADREPHRAVASCILGSLRGPGVRDGCVESDRADRCAVRVVHRDHPFCVEPESPVDAALPVGALAEDGRDLVAHLRGLVDDVTSVYVHPKPLSKRLRHPHGGA